MNQTPFKVCPQCQTPNPVGAGLCSNCQRLFNSQFAVQNRTTAFVPQTGAVMPGKRPRVWPWIALTAAILFFLLFGVLRPHRRGLGDLSDDQIHAAAAAYDQMADEMPLGSSKGEVIQKLGEPDRVRSREGFGDGKLEVLTFSNWEMVFRYGRLQEKSRY